MLRFGNIKNSSAINVSGVTPGSDEFKRLVNESTERLLRRGDFDGTVVPIQVCLTQSGCVVWPRYVGQIRKLNLCKTGVPIHNVWYDFLPFNNQHRWDNWGVPNVSAPYWYSWMAGTSRIVNQARSPVFTDIMGDDRTLRAYPTTPLDVNKKLYIFGEDNNGQRLVTQGIGGWTDGITLTLKTPYVESLDRVGAALKVRRIERVVKDETQGPVRLYAWNTVTSVLEDVAYYEPSETEPSYVRSQLHSACCSTGATRSVVALIKLAYVPVKNDNDWVLIDNLAALKLQMMSVRAEDANDYAGKATLEAAAIRELNLQLADTNPDDQIPIDMGSMGRNGSCIGSQACF